MTSPTSLTVWSDQATAFGVVHRTWFPVRKHRKLSVGEIASRQRRSSDQPQTGGNDAKFAFDRYYHDDLIFGAGRASPEAERQPLAETINDETPTGSVADEIPAPFHSLERNTPRNEPGTVVAISAPAGSASKEMPCANTHTERAILPAASVAGGGVVPPASLPARFAARPDAGAPMMRTNGSPSKQRQGRDAVVGGVA